MEEQALPTAEAIVGKMMRNDLFSQWLGVEVLEALPGTVRLRMAIRPEMVNGFGIAHGGIAYSLADSALAFAANGHGRMAVSTHTDISHFEPLRTGDVIEATARELYLGNKVARYHIDITRADGTLVASFGGSVYRTSKNWTTHEP
jgi:acyl-CoA thioesterase